MVVKTNSCNILTRTPLYSLGPAFSPEIWLMASGFKIGAGSPDCAFIGAVRVTMIRLVSPGLTTRVVIAGRVAFQPRILDSSSENVNES